MTIKLNGVSMTGFVKMLSPSDATPTLSFDPFQPPVVDGVTFPEFFGGFNLITSTPRKVNTNFPITLSSADNTVSSGQESVVMALDRSAFGNLLPTYHPTPVYYTFYISGPIPAGEEIAVGLWSPGFTQDAPPTEAYTDYNFSQGVITYSSSGTAFGYGGVPEQLSTFELGDTITFEVDYNMSQVNIYKGLILQTSVNPGFFSFDTFRPVITARTIPV